MTGYIQFPLTARIRMARLLVSACKGAEMSYDRYRAVHDRSIADPEGFWLDAARGIAAHLP